MHQTSVSLMTVRVAHSQAWAIFLFEPHLQVLNRDTWALESCTAQLCPISTEQAPDRGGVMRPLNRAPFFAVGSISAGISARAPAAAQKALYRVFATLGSSNYSWKVITHPLSELGPYR
jgi:hypothetical protein